MKGRPLSRQSFLRNRFVSFEQIHCLKNEFHSSETTISSCELYHEDSLEEKILKIRKKKGFIVDMDGVLYHADHLLPGVKPFLKWLFEQQKSFLFLTNASDIGPSELSMKMYRLAEMKIHPNRFYTSALATAAFLSRQTPNGSAYVVGTSGLMNALYGVNYTIDDVNPDYVVVGETKTYNFQMIERAVRHVRRGAKLIGTNRDIMDRNGTEMIPSTGSLVSPIELMTNKKTYFIGKPNPLIMSYAMNVLKTPYEETVIIGDRMDTDIQAGLELGIDTVLVLSGVTSKEDLKEFAYKPGVVLDSVQNLLEESK